VLDGTILPGSVAEEVDLANVTHLRDANLSGAPLDGADFSGSDLTDADLS
jgi:Pentapeptide repeats (8 copies).